MALALEAPTAFAADLRTREIPSNHWVVEYDPEPVAAMITDFIRTVTPSQNGDSQ